MDSMKDEREFEQFLRSRHVPDAPSNLTHRIIQGAKDQSSSVSFPVKVIEKIRQFAKVFAIPQPAFVLAAVAVLSIGAVGFYSSDALVVEPTAEYYQAAEEVELAFYLDDIFETDY